MTPAFLNQIIKQYDLINHWYLSVLDGIPDEDGKKRINEQTNSLEWISGHLIVGRHRNMTRMGLELEPLPHLDRFINQSIPPPNAIAFNPSNTYPSLTENRKQWTVYSDMLQSALEHVTDETLSKVLPYSIPINGNSIADALAFVSLHESYHIGQMSIIRKSLGYPAMALGRKK